MDYKNKQQMRVTVDYNYMMEKSLGEKGIKDEEIKSLSAKAAEAFGYVKANRGRDDLFMGWTELPYNQDEIVADILNTQKSGRNRRRYHKNRGRGTQKI